MRKKQTNRKPTLEKVSPEFGSSFAVQRFSEPCPKSKPRSWHFHSEIELVFVKGGCGKRHIGNHMSCYQNGDLVLIGSMLPHTGFIDRLTGNESEVVVHFNCDFLGELFFAGREMGDIERLLKRSEAGVAFYGKTKKAVGDRLEKLVEMQPFDKLIELLSILQELAVSDEYNILNADGHVFETGHLDNDRINDIYDFVREHYKRPITLSEIAQLANMTIPAFCRYFKRISGKTFTRFVNEIRIVEACKLLSEEHLSITAICYECGFNNFSHFNRVFKKITGNSPSAYRNQLTKMLQSATMS